MKKYKFTIHGNVYETQIRKIEDEYAFLEVNGTEYKVKIESEVQQTKTPKLVRSRVDVNPQEANIQQHKSELSALKAPLPGLIVKISVKEGDKVKVGDTILSMEAMKMENNIQSEKDGIVKSIKVKEGQNVMQDDVLAEIE
jgi:biotin carboxyl carrier protein